MKKLFTIVIALAVFTFTAQAQKGEKGVGIGLDIGLPMGNLGDAFGIGIGGSAKGFYGLNDDADVTLTLGYIGFTQKDDSGFSQSHVPFLAGYRHKFDKLYVEPQLGFVTVKSKFSGDSFMGMIGSVSSTNFGYSVGGGYLMDAWDLGLRYQGVSASGGSLGFIGIRVAYNFSF